MKMTLITSGNNSILSLNGKILGAPEVDEIHKKIKEVLGSGQKNIVIDLSEVHWMGSVGIGILICCMTTVRNAGGEMKLCGLSDKMKSILSITRLDDIFEIYPNQAQAEASFA